MTMWQPGVPTKSVLIPKQSQHEADAKVVTSLGTDIQETLDGGTKRLRETQERACFDAAREEILGDLLQKEDAQTFGNLWVGLPAVMLGWQEQPLLGRRAKRSRAAHLRKVTTRIPTWFLK